jgi:hypothetical protein
VKQVGESEWLLDVPRGWSVFDQLECVTLTPPSNGSALQFSSASKEVGPITDADLEEMAKGQPSVTGPPIHVEFGEFWGLGVAYEEGGVAWRRYWLANRSLLLFVTFNGATSHERVDFAEAQTALATLRRRA